VSGRAIQTKPPGRFQKPYARTKASSFTDRATDPTCTFPSMELCCVHLRQQIRQQNADVHDEPCPSEGICRRQRDSAGPMLQDVGPHAAERDCSVCWNSSSILDSLSLLLEILRFYGYRDDQYRISNTFDMWVMQSRKCGFTKFIKYKTAAFFSFHLGEELPPLPDGVTGDNPAHMMCGSAGRFLIYLMRKGGEEAKRLARTMSLNMLYLKKGLPRPSKMHVDLGVVDTLEVLTTVNKKLTPVEEKIFERVKLSITECVREVFSGHKFNFRESSPFAPSTKSNYVSCRSKHGTLGTLIEENLIDVQKVDGLDDLLHNAAVGREGDQRFHHGDLAVLSDDAVVRLKNYYQDVQYKALERSVKEDKNTGLVGLSEALKIRVISKGPPMTYFSLRPLQRFMHSIMRKHRCFHLIGAPVTADYILAICKDAKGDNLSADYRDATNKLDPRLSEHTVSEICDVCEIPDDLRKLFLTALTGHFIHYRFYDGCVPVSDVLAKQLWGQLMGSIVSFPILCLINAAICRAAYIDGNEETFTLAQSLTKFRLDKIPLGVNGDDAFMKCLRRVYNLWKSYAAISGLAPSVGKVYFHPRYLNINSTSYHLDNGTCTLIPYINCGLLLGKTRSSIPGLEDMRTQSESDFEALSNLGSQHHELIESCPPDLQLVVHKSFIRHNYGLLQKYKMIPWFVSRSRGGIGMRPLRVFVNDIETDEYLSLKNNSSFGPSRLDRICCELQLQTSEAVPCLSYSLDESARKAWTAQCALPDRAWALPEDGFLRKCQESQSEIFGVLDTLVYYQAPGLLLPTLRRKRRLQKAGLIMKKKQEKFLKACTKFWPNFVADDCEGSTYYNLLRMEYETVERECRREEIHHWQLEEIDDVQMEKWYPILHESRSPQTIQLYRVIHYWYKMIRRGLSNKLLEVRERAEDYQQFIPILCCRGDEAEFQAHLD
jgi:hypothetical protein